MIYFYIEPLEGEEEPLPWKNSFESEDDIQSTTVVENIPEEEQSHYESDFEGALCSLLKSTAIVWRKKYQK